jgi:SAM-dependent methyltransferase
MVKRWLRASRGSASRNVARFETLGSTTPASRVFGFDRGQPIDRWYIERFLQHHAADIHGHVLEIGGGDYARRFGGASATRIDVLHVESGQPGTTVVADLADAPHLESNAFDCIIATQTLQHIYQVRGAIATLHRVLTPGGVLLMTVPGISQISRFDMERWGDYWRFTTLSMQRLCQEVFAPANVTVESAGNVLAAAAFLHGLASAELNLDELTSHDRDYQLLITVRAIK